MSSDLVSVIIPVHNSEQFLVESLESVLNQTYKNLEIITVDDGSTDNSMKILNQYSDKIIIIHQKNQGLDAALNTGIKKMRGKWFKWFSPDDVMYSNCIETLLEEAKKLPDNTIIYSNWEIIDEHGKKLRNFSESNYNDLSNFDFNVRLLDGQQINVNTCLVPSFLFNKGCVIRQLSDPVTIDYDFFLRAGILYESKFHLVEKNLIKYRIHASQLSHKNIVDSLQSVNEIAQQILSIVDQKTRNDYVPALEQFRKSKPFAKKTMNLGLEMLNKLLPRGITNEMITFYLSRIRRARN